MTTKHTNPKARALNDAMAVHFRDELRQGRAIALKNAESFDEIVFVLERLGAFLNSAIENLGNYKPRISEVAADSPLASELPEIFPSFHLSFDDLYFLVRDGRNSELHQGAFARHLTLHAVELALILEDALMNNRYDVGHYMVRNPVVAQMWQPLSFIRQMMLANSFSYLPVPITNADKTDWQLVRDMELARYLRGGGTNSERKDRLSTTLEQAVGSGVIALCQPKLCRRGDRIEDVLGSSDAHPALVISERDGELLGILTPFDLL